MDTRHKKWIVIYLVILFGTLLLMSQSLHRSKGSDFRGFLIAGERFIHGEFLYEGSGVATNVTWPPFFAIFILPFTLLARLNPRMAQVIWYLLNTFLFFLSIDIWVRLFDKQSFGWFDDRKKYSFFAMGVFLPIVFVSQLIYRVHLYLQINILIMFLMSLSFYYHDKGKEFSSGFWLGMVTAIKVFPVLVLPYFLFRRKWKTVIAFGFTLLILTLLPVFRYGWQPFQENLLAWFKIALIGRYPIGGLNQSVVAMLTRWVASDPFLLMRTRLPAPDPSLTSVIVSTWLYRGLYVMIMGLFFYLLFKKQYRNTAVEGAFLITLAMVFSPIAWRNYFIITFPAYFVLYNLYLRYRDKIYLYCVLLACFLISFLQIVGETGPHVRGFFNCVTSSLTIGALVLLFGCLAVILRNADNEYMQD